MGFLSLVGAYSSRPEVYARSLLLVAAKACGIRGNSDFAKEEKGGNDIFVQIIWPKYIYITCKYKPTFKKK
jgi:hypothetical protein